MGKTNKIQTDIAALTELANSGDIKAIRYLGYAYSEGVGVSLDRTIAAKFASLGCKQGDKFCCLQLGTLLFILKNNHDAGEVFKRLLDQNYLPTFYRLGMHYYIGEVTTQNRAEGERLLRIAAERGHFKAVRKVAAIDWRKAPFWQKPSIGIRIIRNSLGLYKAYTRDPKDERLIS